MNLESLSHFQFDFSTPGTKSNECLFGPVSAGGKKHCGNVSHVQIHGQNPLTGTPTHTCSFWDLFNCVPTILVDFFSSFFEILVGTTCWQAPRMRMSSTLISPLLNRANHSRTCVRLSASTLKAFWSISCASVAVFPRQKQNLKQIRCSVQSDITISQEELDNTWENWQHKPVQPSTAMSAWLLTHEGCNYTHLAGEHSTTIRKSSPKPVWFFLGPPTYIKVIWTLPNMYTMLYLQMSYYPECFISHIAVMWMCNVRDVKSRTGVQMPVHSCNR